MNFLERLAPARPGDSSRAVAAPRARFEAERPLRELAPIVRAGTEEMGLDPMEGGAAAESEPVGPGETRSVGAIAERRTMEGTRTYRGSTPGDARSAEAPLGHARDEPTTGAPVPMEHPSVGREAEVRERGAARRVLPPPTHAAPRTDAKPSGLAATATAPRQDAPADMLKGHAGPAAIGIWSPSPTPLSKAALATRTSPVTPPRPVIHVTIDRIEVRAPAAAPRPAPRSPPSVPGVSLSDYLRGESATKSGGGRR